MEGILNLSGPTLSATTVVAIESRMVMGPTAAMVARRAGVSLIKPKVYKAIPYIGWAIAIGSALYAGYEAYNATYVNWKKLENEIYDDDDMRVFRRGYTESAASFADTIQGTQAADNEWRFILIPSEVMPMIAAVDTVGIQNHGNVLRWDPENKVTRRRQTTSGLPPAGPIAYSNGNTVRGSWEEYPFASTLGLGVPGVHVDRAPLRENWIQGGFIRAAAMVQRFSVGDTVRSYIL